MSGRGDRSPRIVSYRGKWCVQFWDGPERRRVSLGNLDATAAHLEEAKRAFRDFAKQLAAPVGNTCQDIYDAYIKDKAASEKPLVAEQRVKDAWKALKWHFAPLMPEQISRDTCREYIRARRAEGRQDGTIRKELAVLRACLNWNDPKCPAVWEFPSSPPAKDRWLTRDQFQALLDAAKDTHHLTVFLHVALATGARKEAIFQLQWDTHIQFERGQIFLGFKRGGKKRATVPMTDTLRAVLQDAKKLATTDYVVEFAKGPVKAVRTSLEKAAERAGLYEDDAQGNRKVWVSPHVLRHTAGVWMAEAGVPLEQICDFLGHSDISVTKRVYARYQPEHMRQARAALDVGAIKVVD